MTSPLLKQAVDDLGGPAEVASLVGVSTVEAVYNAIRRGSFPHSWRIKLYQESKRRNITIAPELLGFDSEASNAP